LPLGRFGFFFDADRAPVFAELDDAVALGIFHLVREDARAGFSLAHVGDERRQIVSIKNVVAEDQADRIMPDELGADGKRLRDSLGFGLNFVR